MSIPWLLNDLWQFLKQPRPDVPAELPERAKWTPVLQLAAITLVAGSLMALFPQVLESLHWIEPLNNDKMEQMLEQVGVGWFLVLGSVAAPVLEELIFRWPLGSSRWSFTLLLVCFYLFVTSYLTPHIRLLNFLLLFFEVLALVVMWFSKDVALRSWLDRYWKKYFVSIFYLVNAIFALYHLTNYEPTTAQLYFAPVIFLPQFVAGLCCGYARLRYGLVWAMLVHSLYNLALLGLAFATGSM